MPNGIAPGENGWSGEPIPPFPVKLVTPSGEKTVNMDFGNNDESSEAIGLKSEDGQEKKYNGDYRGNAC
jgi:hypothetical protein